MSVIDDKLLLTEEEVSKLTGLPRGSLRNARIQGRRSQGPPWVKIMGRVFYPTGQLKRWVASLKLRGGEIPEEEKTGDETFVIPSWKNGNY